LFFFENLDASEIIVLLAFLGAFASIMAVGIPILMPDLRRSRMKMVAEKRRELHRTQIAVKKKSPASLRDSVKENRAALMSRILGNLNLSQLLFTDDLTDRLSQAGIRGKTASISFVFSRVVLGLFGLSMAIFIISVWKDFPYPFAIEIIIIVMSGAFGFFLPNILIYNIAQKRRTEMTAAFPDTMDLMVICVEAGLSIEKTFDKLAEEIADTSPILSDEIALTSAELAYLNDRGDAYENFAKRSGLHSVKQLTTTLAQSESYGTPVAVAVNGLANEKRAERMSVAETKAASLPAKLTVPMIVFFLPVLFMVVIGPAVIRIMQ